MDYLTGENFKKYLTTKYIGKTIIHFDQIDSTNLYAKNMGDTLEHGTVITCEEQKTGRGRLGKKWESQSGSMCMSILVKPEIKLHQVSKITQVCAAAVSIALDELSINTQIKWPNDIIMNNKKICGILTEMKTEMNVLTYIVIGIGLNVNNEDFPNEIQNTATSIFIETGLSFEKNIIAAKILNNFEILYDEFIKDNYKASLDICRKKSYVLGKQINLIENNIVKKAKAIDLGNDGELIVQYEDGRIDNIISGEISVRLS
ncbi:MAG: biotin--[acetyl-CoA-carboxylase] ligase [Sedimentibacter sp.]